MKHRSLPIALRLVSGLLIPVQILTVSQVPLLAAVTSPSPASENAAALLAPAQAIPPPPPPVSVKVNTVPPPTDLPGLLKGFSAKPADSEFLTLRPLKQPLLSIGGKTTIAENQALVAALAEHKRHFHDPESAKSLQTFLDKHPKTAWRASIQTNLGLIYRTEGYWTKALSAWGDAWNLGRAETEPLRHQLIDCALAEQAELLARLGRVDELTSLLGEAGDREVRGANREKLSNARVSLNLERTEPEKSFRCGPFAVGRIWVSLNPDKALPDSIFNSRCTNRGTSLVQVRALADSVGLHLQAAKRKPGASLIFPSVVHWKAGHFAAVLGKDGDSYHIQDPTFGIDMHIQARAFDEEASGYFLVPEGSLPDGWKAVAESDAAQVWGKGAVAPTTPPPPPCDGPSIDCQGCEISPGMARYDVDPSRVNLVLKDTPLWYSPPVGPAVNITANYSARDSDPQILSNLGPLWNLNVVSYLLETGNSGHYQTSTWTTYDDSGNPIAHTEQVWILDTLSVNLYGPGGGALSFVLASGNGWVSAKEPHSGMVLTWYPGGHWAGTQYIQAPGYFLLSYPNGSSRRYDEASIVATFGAVMTESSDAFGNKLQYGYDADLRLISITDALLDAQGHGQVTTFTYGPYLYLVHQVTDPFGRTCTFDYNNLGQLWKITDSGGIVSEFTYGSGDLITALTTPYGMTHFVETDTGNDRQLDITDPAGNTERILFKYSDANAVPDMAAPRPSAAGLSIADTTFWPNRNTYHWDKKAFAEGAGNYAAAHLMHWLHTPDMAAMTDILESEKPALESRIYYNYAGQTDPKVSSGAAKPSKIARVLDDGTTQVWSYTYNSLDRVTSITTPGDATTPPRTTKLFYDADNIDVGAAYQANAQGATDLGGDHYDLLGAASYYAMRLPHQIGDASGQLTTFTYNAHGQIKTVTNAKGETTTFYYDHNANQAGQDYGYLVSVAGPQAGATTTFQPDGFGRLYSVTDSQGYTVTVEYEAIGGLNTKTLNRPVKLHFPDGTYTQTIYNVLDAEWVRDRAGRWTHLLHDPLRHVVATEDPMGRFVQYKWCGCGSLEAIIDAMGNQTTWVRDAQKRVTDKVYADGTLIHYAYENNTSRLKSKTDALGQKTTYFYNIDGSVNGVTYANAINSTPNVSYTYEPVYGRLASMVDGIGTTQYAYNPIPLNPSTTTPATLGAGRLYSIDGPFADAAITYAYDELGRIATRSINGAANQTSVSYDSLGRISSATDLLGTFTPHFVGVTGQLDYIDYPNTQRVAFDYFPNNAQQGTGNGDRRLKQIRNLGVGAGGTGSVISQFDYTFDVAGRINTWNQSDSGSAAARQYVFRYDSDDELRGATLKNLTTSATTDDQAYGYDANGNRTLFQDNQAPVSAAFNELNQLLTQGAGGSLQLRGTLDEPGTLSVSKLNPMDSSVQSTVAASVDPTTNGFEANVPADVGANTYRLRAIDGSANATIKTINITVPAADAKASQYDLNGNTLNSRPAAAPTVVYAWDARNQLVRITKNGDVTEFVYDGKGRRVKEKLNTVEIRHWVWIGLSIAEERGADNVVTKRYFAHGEKSLNGDVFYYTRDHLGSIREVTNAAGTPVTRYAYGIWGDRTATHLVGTTDVDFGFTGHYQHASGLLLSPLRAYDPLSGRWISRDPLGEAGGLNLYGYSSSDPINHVDPTGGEEAAATTVLEVVEGGLLEDIILAVSGAIVVVGAEQVGYNAYKANPDWWAENLWGWYYPNQTPTEDQRARPRPTPAPPTPASSCPATASPSGPEDPNDDDDEDPELDKTGPKNPDGSFKEKGQQDQELRDAQEREIRNRPETKGDEADEDWEGFKRPKMNSIRSKQRTEDRSNPNR